MRSSARCKHTWLLDREVASASVEPPTITMHGVYRKMLYFHVHVHVQKYTCVKRTAQYAYDC